MSQGRKQRRRNWAALVEKQQQTMEVQMRRGGVKQLDGRRGNEGALWMKRLDTVKDGGGRKTKRLKWTGRWGRFMHLIITSSKYQFLGKFVFNAKSRIINMFLITPQRIWITYVHIYKASFIPAAPTWVFLFIGRLFIGTSLNTWYVHN